MDNEALTARRKSLRINLDESIYGAFAEIGGGQEVARNFFQAGGASGTVAKTISAYDKAFSDAIYDKSKSGRYVSEDRLCEMLAHEYGELEKTLKGKTAPDVRYFVFADTVATLNYRKDNTGHGWLGVRFQLVGDARPNEVVVHVNLLENDGLQQQETIGTLGVNLIYACYNHYTRPNSFIRSLMDNLSPDRVEINMLSMKGPQLDYVDNRLLGVQLVSNGMTPATMFDRDGAIRQPSDMLYKKNVLAFRGSFRPITYVGYDMLKTSMALFSKDEDYEKDNTITLCEMTLSNLMADDGLDERDFLDRVDLLNGAGQHVMVSNFREFYKLTSYLSRFRIRNLRLVIGILTFIKIWEEQYYTHLNGGILEAFGKLFGRNTKIYVYPTVQPGMKKLLTSDDLPVSYDLKHLYEYLKANRKIIDLEDVDSKHLHIYPHDVIRKIKLNDSSWEDMVPNYIAETIKTKKLFGYKR